MNKLSIQVESDRLLLKTMEKKYVTQNYADWLNNTQVNKFLSCVNTFHTIDTCNAYVDSYKCTDQKALIGIFNKDNNMHIGNLSLSTINWYRKAGAIGISIGDQRFQRKGLATEALLSFRDYCFQKLGLHRLWCGVAQINLESLKLFLNCGFVIEGRLRDSDFIDGEHQSGYMLSVLKTDIN
jgi:[ribosomal protein S5]-alanine N-acetyltransferase